MSVDVHEVSLTVVSLSLFLLVDMASHFEIFILIFVHFLCILEINVLVLQKGSGKYDYILVRLTRIEFSCIFLFMFVCLHRRAGKAVSPETK